MITTVQHLSNAGQWFDIETSDSPEAAQLFIDAQGNPNRWRIKPPSPQELADRFARVLLNWLKPHELADVRKLNATETSPHVCHSHDYCDANMAMHEAWKSFGLEDCDADDEAQATLWCEAWDIAKRQHLTGAY